MWFIPEVVVNGQLVILSERPELLSQLYLFWNQYGMFFPLNNALFYYWSKTWVNRTQALHCLPFFIFSAHQSLLLITGKIPRFRTSICFCSIALLLARARMLSSVVHIIDVHFKFASRVLFKHLVRFDALSFGFLFSWEQFYLFIPFHFPFPPTPPPSRRTFTSIWHLNLFC